MNIQKFKKGLATIVSSTLITLFGVQPALSAPLTLPTAPLFLSSLVEPNVFFTLDDSGSMDNVFLVKDVYADFTAKTGIISSLGGQPLDNGTYIGYFHPTWPRLYNELSLAPSNGTNAAFDKYWIFRNHNGNKLYYNTDTTYKPWAGTKVGGAPMYIDANPTAALREPTAPGGDKVDLTATFDYFDRLGTSYPNSLYLPTFFTWQDDGDGIIETSDGHTMVEIKPANAPFSYTDSTGTAKTRTYAEELQNFANFFVYYRSRINAAKASIGQVISNTEATRMGMDLFNRTLVRKDLKSMSNAADKRALLTHYYSLIIPNKSTPARTSLQKVGNYFANNASGAIVSAANGGECQQNFNILLSDGFWNGADPALPGGGNTDIDGTGIFDGNALQSNDGGKYDDAQVNTLADVAMHYYETDLRTDLLDKVPTAAADKAPHQHLVNFAVSFGLTGTSFGPGNAFNSSNTDPATLAAFSWPLVNSDAGKVDDLWHAAYNGRGKYLNAQNPAELENSLAISLDAIAKATATAAAVSINSAKLTTSSVIYLAEFNTNRWQGDLEAFKILRDPVTGALSPTGQLSPTPDWKASAVLDARNIATNPRVILTHDSTATTTAGVLQDGIPFQWSKLNTTQQNDLRTSPTGVAEPSTTALPNLTYPVAEAKLNHLRGSRVDEGAGNFLRVRASLLGDLVNSAPVYVGAPSLRWPDTAPFPTGTGQRYSDFKSGSAKSRSGVIYTGSNDGMLHGFSETGGHEVLAYIPENLFSTSVGGGLHYLTEQNYQHKFYNDLTPSISDIYTDLGSGTAWHSILIGGQRGGGRGIYALDVTNPTAFTEANAAKLVLWEFTNTDNPNLGYSYSKPQIAKSNDSQNSWVAIFGNGYNNTGDGKAKLFVLTIDKGTDGAWTIGSDYQEISAGTGTAGTPNGLSTPTLVDLDGNGTVDRAYAGDLKGQMWAFDLSNTTAASWGLANGSTSPLFTTIGGRPITGQPAVSKHPTISDVSGNLPNIMVYFGSGQYLTNSDKTDTTDSHFYGVWDRGDSNLDATTLPLKLVEQTYNSAFTQRVLSRNSVNYAGGEYGWYFRLNRVNPLDLLEDKGERSVTRPVVRGDVVFFNSFIPSTDPCSIGGYGYRFAVDLLTGGSANDAVADTDGDGDVDGDDKATIPGTTTTDVIAAIRQNGYLPAPVFLGSSDDDGTSGGGGPLPPPCKDLSFTGATGVAVKCLPTIRTGRFSWQELLQ